MTLISRNNGSAQPFAARFSFPLCNLLTLSAALYRASTPQTDLFTYCHVATAEGDCKKTQLLPSAEAAAHLKEHPGYSAVPAKQPTS